MGSTETVVVRGPDGDADVRCCGVPMLDSTAAGERTPAPDQTGELTQIEKRYVDDEAGIELLCTKPGDGPLTCDGRSMNTKGAKPLPASD